MIRKLALLGTLALLLWHARIYAFLCDDAFISFRYARNLADGYGLVFNPGFERVEGYTNFLWVVILAAFDVLGLKPETVANPISIALTIGLWGMVAWFASRRRAGDPAWTALVAPLLLAATRSIAVWSTSGLETRLFEVLVVGAIFRLVVEIEGEGRRPWAALLFALATLTRPDGLLIAACVLSAGAAWRWSRRTIGVRGVVVQAAIFWAIVGAHFLWRKAYYGEWLPNTYYAKVGGRAWWDMGLQYLAAFLLEYAAWIWLPLVGIGAWRLGKRGAGHVPLLFGAAILPHAVYVASIGGDHFEYRPLDLYLPLLFLLVGEGVRGVASRRVVSWAWVGACLFAVAWLPWRSHREFPREYLAGFPGVRPQMPEAAAFLDPASDPVYRWPGIRTLGGWYREALRATTGRFVGVRQEEHRLFFDVVSEQAAALRKLVDDGKIPKDTHIAISCVGVIPYVTDLRTLDRLGLTDEVVARSSPGEVRILAHDKHATFAYAREAGVDLWSVDPVIPDPRASDARLQLALVESERSGEPFWFAPNEGDRFLAVRFPRGDDARAKFPRLEFRSTADAASRATLDDAIASAARSEAAPGSTEARIAAAADLAREGRYDEAIAAYRALDDGRNLDVIAGLGNAYAALGRYDDAAREFGRMTELRPDVAMGWFNLGVARAKAGNADDGVAALSRAVELEATNVEARYALGAAALTAGKPQIAKEQASALRGIGGKAAREKAARLEQALSN